MTPPPEIHDRDVALAGQLGELRGMVLQVLQQMTALVERVQVVETSSSSRMSHLEVGVAQLDTQLRALTQQHIDDMRRLAEERVARQAAEREARRSEEQRQQAAAAAAPRWWNTASGLAAVVSIVMALLVLGGAIYATR